VHSWDAAISKSKGRVIEYQKLSSGICKSKVQKEGRAAVEKSASLAGAMGSDKFAIEPFPILAL
jgi:hypothetical protein